MPFTLVKLKVSGRLVELQKYERPMAYGYTRDDGRRGPRVAKERNLESTLSAGYRAKSVFKHLCFANAWAWKQQNGKTPPPIFNTFTFKENRTDRKSAIKDFTRALERINYHLRDQVPEGLKYVVVPEVQTRGAFHFHQLVFNQPYIPQVYDWFDEIWGHGHVDVRAVTKNSQSLPGYLAKYLAKDMESARPFNGRRYFSSKGLLKTISYSNEGHIDLILNALPPGTKKIVYERPTEIRKIGKMWLTHFFLPENLELIDTIDSFKVSDDANILPSTMEAEDKPSPADVL